MDTSVLIKVARALNPVNLVWKYKWVINNDNPNIAKKLELTGMKKYWKRTGQVEIKLNWLYD